MKRKKTGTIAVVAAAAVLAFAFVLFRGVGVEAAYPFEKARMSFGRKVWTRVSGLWRGAESRAENVRLRREVASLAMVRSDCERLAAEVGNGTYEACGQISQKYICRECGHYFNSRTETAYDGLRTNADKFDLAIKCLNEGMGVRATARTVGCSVSTVQRWTVRASVQAAAVSSSFENNLDPSGMQFDEMSGTLKKN